MDSILNFAEIPGALLVPAILLSIWLGYRASGLSFQKQRIVLCLLAAFFVLSEIAKQLMLTISNCHYVWWNFPFQLCSMPIYLLPMALILSHSEAFSKLCSRSDSVFGSTGHTLSCPATCKSPRHKKIASTIFLFLADFSTLAGLATFLDTSGLHYELPVLTLHSYLWHFLMIFMGVMLGCSRKISSNDSSEAENSETRSFSRAALVFLLCSAIAEFLNAILHTKGTINMFYISLWEPMSQIVFKDIAVLYGQVVSVIIYLISIIIGAFVIHCIFRWGKVQ